MSLIESMERRALFAAHAVSRHSHGSHLLGGDGDDDIDTNDDKDAIVDAGDGTDHVDGEFHGQGSGIEFHDGHPDQNDADNGMHNETDG